MSLLLLFKQAVEGYSVSANQTLAPVTQTATLSAVSDISAAQTLAVFTQTATISAVVELTANQTLAAVTQVATADAGAQISANQQLASISQSATLSTVAEIEANQNIPPITQDATLAPPFAGGGSRAKSGKKYGLEPVVRPKPQPKRPKLPTRPIQLPTAEELEWLSGRRLADRGQWAPPDIVTYEHPDPMALHRQMQDAIDENEIAMVLELL